MQTQSRPARGALSPGTDPVALRLITVAVLAGLIITGVAVALTGGPPPAAGRLASGEGPGQRDPRSAAPAGAQQSAGVRLLRAAAQACSSVAYQGVEVVAWRGPYLTSTSVVDVWHQQDGQTLAKVASAPPEWPHPARLFPFEEPGSTQSLAGNGILGMDTRLVSLIAANYSLAVTGHGEVVGRPARVVTARRRDGTVAARFWLDSATSLPLRRQMFGTRARLVSDVVFARLTVVRGRLPGVPTAGARPWGHVLRPAQLAALRAHGWPVPGTVLATLSLLSAKEGTTAPGTVVDLDYSDGISVISIFIQRGHLPSDMSGWTRVAMGGYRVYADDPRDLSLSWSADGFVYTVIAAAPEQTISAVIAALPHDADRGFLSRIRRGLHRLFSWASP